VSGNLGFLQFANNAADTFSYIGSDGSLLRFETGGAERMRIDSSGNLLVGTTSIASGYKFQVQGWGGFRHPSGDAVLAVVAGNTTGSSLLYFGDSASDTVGQVAYNHTSNAMFFNTNGSERARIDSSGSLLVGHTTAGLNVAGNGFSLQTVSAYSVLSIGHASGTGSNAQFLQFSLAGTGIGSITQSGTTAVLYNTTSDQRLKENIQDAAPASALIDALQVRQYDWKADGSHQRYGFIAQELVAVAPEAVHQPADPEAMMAVDYSKLVPMLVKEIQSLRARLAAANI
jgi:hypothetical protein